MYKYVLTGMMIIVVGFASGNLGTKTHSLGINAGILQPVAGYADADIQYHFGILYWYETAHLVGEVSAYGITRSRVKEFCFPEFSLLYMLSKKDISPYFGGGVGFGWLALARAPVILSARFSDMVPGLILNAGGGVVFLRTADIRIILDARYHVNFANIPGFTGPHHGFKFSIGFAFRRRFRGCCGCGIAY